jgi:D-amino-acid dehydrogenase
MSGRVLVIGGGVIGAACANYLDRAGWQVVVIDRGTFGGGCSHGNCGFVCPSHVLPLAEPGAVGKTLQAMLRPDSPFSIKPRLDLNLWAFLYRFARRCNRADMLEAGAACHALLHSSLDLYRDLMATEALDCEWQTRGLLFVYQRPAEMDHYATTDQLLREHFNLPAKRYDGAALTELEPALKSGLAGGWYYEEDAHLRPDKLLSSWRRLLESRGVVVREHCEMKRFVREHGRARALVTTQGELAADAFVVATGAWTPLLNHALGCRIPIEPGKGYSLTMPRPSRCPQIPMIFTEHKVAVTPLRSGYRLGSTMEFAGYDATLNRKRLKLLRSGARPYLHEPYCEPVEEEWYGWRPMTPDGKPVIDRAPGMSNVYLAAGHNMLGLSMAPATGKLIAEMVSGTEPHIDPTPFALQRF